MSRTPERDQIFRDGEREQLKDIEQWLLREREQHAIAARIRGRNRDLAVRLGGITPAGYVHPDVGVFAICGLILRSDHVDRLRTAETLFAQATQKGKSL